MSFQSINQGWTIVTGMNYRSQNGSLKRSVLQDPNIMQEPAGWESERFADTKRIIDDLVKNLDESKQIDMCLIDFSKDFDNAPTKDSWPSSNTVKSEDRLRAGQRTG